MLTQEQKTIISSEAVKTEMLLKKFPDWKFNTRGETFPTANDVKAIAGNIQIFDNYVTWEQVQSSPKRMIKYFVFKCFHTLFKPFFRKQLILNEYVWLLAGTVARQNERIANLEQKLNEASNSN